MSCVNSFLLMENGGRGSTMTDSTLCLLRDSHSLLPTIWQGLHLGPHLVLWSTALIHMKNGFTGRSSDQTIDLMIFAVADTWWYCSSVAFLWLISPIKIFNWFCARKVGNFGLQYYYYTTSIQGLFFQDNLGESAPDRQNQFWILMKQEMMGWQWHQLDHMYIMYTSLQTDNHSSTSPLSFYSLDALPATQPTVSKHWRLWTKFIKCGMRVWYYLENVYDCSAIFLLAICRPSGCTV